MQIVDGQSTKTNLVGLVHVYPCRGSHLHQCRPVLSVYVQADHIYIQGIIYIYIYIYTYIYIGRAIAHRQKTDMQV